MENAINEPEKPEDAQMAAQGLQRIGRHYLRRVTDGFLATRSADRAPSSSLLPQYWQNIEPSVRNASQPCANSFAKRVC
jgi:hypothetical protein